MITEAERHGWIQTLINNINKDVSYTVFKERKGDDLFYGYCIKIVKVGETSVVLAKDYDKGSLFMFDLDYSEEGVTLDRLDKFDTEFNEWLDENRFGDLVYFENEDKLNGATLTIILSSVSSKEPLTKAISFSNVDEAVSQREKMVNSLIKEHNLSDGEAEMTIWITKNEDYITGDTVFGRIENCRFIVEGE